MSRIERVTLEDRWTSTGEETLLTGTQALVRLPFLRRQMDDALGWNTAGYITGYRGSPLGGYDRELGHHRKRLAEGGIVFEPGLNEDLAATACWGTQQLGLYDGAKKEGVFAIWYGKGPGVDRSGDVLRHANGAGTAPRGGVLALAGDDPSAKSSTVTNTTEHAFLDLEMPMLDPADVAEVLEYGLKGIALSRYSGLWVAMKCVAETMDATMSLVVDPARYATVDPPIIAPDGLHIRLKDFPLAIEARLRGSKLPAALAFARANGINRIVADAPRARFGIAVRGKAYNTMRQALADAGISDDMLREQGVRIWKLGMPWPFDIAAARDFAQGLAEVLVIEDRRAHVEPLLRDALYELPDRPHVSGKRDPDGAALLSELTELDAGQILRALHARLPEALRTARMLARIAELDALAQSAQPPVHLRPPHFCPGCPHNTSTRVPEGSHGLAGIGCHYLAKDMNRESDLFTHMGGEGAPWIGQKHFSETRHVFTNMGDGTYAHSGVLAIRAAIATKTRITYKILVNSAVAMTGGQHPEGEVTVPRIAAQMVAEGATEVVVVGDDPERHRGDPLIPATVRFYPRAELDAVQRRLREVDGTTVLIYDQECATERRRKRKRGLAEKATKRVMINPRVCEDCGDCSVKSNCIAVEPIETPFGRKRRIDQSNCNQDFSCLEGFCPSFVTLLGAEPLRPPAPKTLTPPAEPVRAAQAEAWNLVIAGVGGQGVTALSAILAMAAHLEERPVRGVDALGLAQKGGGVFAQLRVGLPNGEPLLSPRIGQGQVDVMIAADMVVAHGRFARPLLSPHRSVAVLSDGVAPTAEFVLNPETQMDAAAMRASLEAACQAVVALPAARAVENAFGDLIYLNVYLLGVAYQRGLVPIGSAAIMRALELNGAEVARNQAAFTAGRHAALTRETPLARETLEAMIARRVADLTGYQSRRYAARYQDFVARVAAAEKAAQPGENRLTRAVATQLYRLMAYKDEYEVARLHSLPEWQAQLRERFTGTTRIEMHLAPPFMGDKKRAFGPWMLKAMGLLRHGRFLRASMFDPFGHTAERREEAALPGEYIAGLEAMLPHLGTHAEMICQWAEAAAGIKGYGPIKARNLAAARAAMAALHNAVMMPPKEPHVRAA